MEATRSVWRWIFALFLILGPVPRSVAQESPKSLPPVIPLRYTEVLTPAENSELTTDEDWAELPRGDQVLGGVAFHIDGMIRLASRTSVARRNAFRERVVLAVPPGTYGSIHLLGATAWRADVNREIAEIVWQYADGGARRTPILYAGSLRRVWRMPFEQPRHVLSPLSKCVATWSSDRSRSQGAMLRLYRATFANPEPGRAVASIQLQSSMDDASLIVFGVSMDPLPAGERPDPTADLEPEDPEWRGQWKVTVLAPGGTGPVAGASVVAQVRAEDVVAERVATSSGAGVVSVPIPTSGVEQVELTVRAKGYSDTHVKIEASPTSPLPGSFRLRMLEAADLGGVVKDAGGKPLAGVNVEVYRFWIGDDPVFEGLEEPGFARRSLKTGTDGRWSMEGVPARNLRRVGIWFRHPDHSEVQIYSVAENPTVEAELREKRHSLRMEAAARVLGIVTDPEGKPVPKTRIRLAVRNVAWSHQATTDVSGTFTVNGVVARRTVFLANPEGFSPYANEFILEPGLQEVRIQLEKGSVFRGRVVGPDNQPVPDVRVSGLRPQNQMDVPWPQNLIESRFSTLTDSEGRWAWTSGPSLAMEFRFQHEDFDLKMGVPVKPNGEEVQVQLQKPREVVGTVIDDETGQPVPKYQIEPQGQQVHWGDPEEVEAVDGRFTLLLNKGEISTLRFLSPTHVPQEEPIPAANNGIIQMVVRLKRADDYSGTVVDGAGRPVAKASVVPTGDEGGYVDLLRGGPDVDPRVVKTSEDGKFQLRPEHPPLGVAAVSPEGFGMVSAAEFRSSRRITLQPYGSIQGSYRGWTDEDRTARLTLTPFSVEGSEPLAFAGGWAGPETIVSFGANFSFSRVPAGRHGLIRIVKTDGGGAHVEIASVTVLPGQIAPVTVTGQGARIRIRLVVPSDVDEREILRSARLTVVHPFPIRPEMTEAEYRAGASDPANSNAMRGMKAVVFLGRPDGSYEAEGVSAGEYDLVALGVEQVFKGGGSRYFACRRVTIPAGIADFGTVDLGSLELKLQPPRPVPPRRQP